jgi:hypothetical protein
MLWQGTRALCVALGIVSILILVNSGINDPYVGMVMVPICGLLSILIHEFGHAIGAWCVDWRVVVFSVHRAAWHAKNRELAWLPREARNEAAGFVFATPANSEANTHLRHMAVIAGGPLFSLLQTVCGVVLVAAIPSRMPLGPVMADNVAAGLAVQGLTLLLASIVPDTKTRRNDGRMLIDALKANRAGEVRNPLGSVGGLLKYKVRLKDLPHWMVDEINVLPNTSPEFQAFLASIEVGRTLDCEPVDVPRARLLLNSYREQYEPSDWLWACDAFVASVYERNLSRADEMIGKIGEPSTLPQMAFAARAATCMLAGNRDAAERFLNQMDDAIAKTSPFNDLTFRDIRKRIEAIEPLAGGGPASLQATEREA